MDRVAPQTHQTLLTNAAKDHRLSLGVRILSYFGWAATVYCAINRRGWKVISGSAALSVAGTTAGIYLHRRALHTEKAAHRARPFDPNSSYPELVAERGWEDLKVHPDQANLRGQLLKLPYQFVLSSDYQRERQHFGIDATEIRVLLTKDFEERGFIPFFEQHGAWGVAGLNDKEAAKKRFLELPYRDMTRPDWGRSLDILKVTPVEINFRVNADAIALRPLEWWQRHHEGMGLLSQENRNLLADRSLRILDELATSEWGPYEGVTLLNVANLRRWDEGISSVTNFLELAPKIASLSPSLLENRQILPRSYGRALEICLDAPFKSLQTRRVLLKRWFGIDEQQLKQILNSECARANSFTNFVSTWSHKDHQEYFSALFNGLTPENQRHLKSLYLQNPPAWLPAALGLTKEDVMEAMKATGYPNMYRLHPLCNTFSIGYNITVYMVLDADVKALSYREFKAKHGLSWRGTSIDPKNTLDSPLRERLEAAVNGASLEQLAELEVDCNRLAVDFSEAGKRATDEALKQTEDVAGLLQLPPLAYRQKWVSRDLEQVRSLVITFLRNLSAEERQALLGSSNDTYKRLTALKLVPDSVRRRIEEHQKAYSESNGQLSAALQQRTFAQDRPDAPDRLRRMAETAENRPLLEQQRDGVIQQFAQALAQLA